MYMYIAAHLAQFTFQSHGFDHMLTFHNLKRLGLFCEAEPSSAANQKLSQLGKFGSEVANIARSSPFRSLSKRLGLVRVQLT